jgi:hypothetical protein
MKTYVLFAAAVWLAAATMPAAAQVYLDMNAIKCSDWLGYSPDAQDFVRYWMSGYYNAVANNNILDYDGLKKNSARITAYCKQNRSNTLPTAIQNSAR